MASFRTIYTSFRNKAEKKLESLGRWVFRNRFKTLFMVFLFTSAEGMLYENDPIRIDYNVFRDQFGSDEAIIVAIKPPEVFADSFFKKLKTFHEDIETGVPYLKDVRSLANARHTRGEGDVLIVEELLEGWPETPVDFEKLKKLVLNNPFFINNYISRDGDYAAVVIETEASIAGDDDLLVGFEKEDAGKQVIDHVPEKGKYLSDKEKAEVVKEIKNILDQYQDTDFQIYFSGGPVVEDAFNRATIRDVALCMVISPLPVVFFPFFLFRRFSGVVLPYIIIMPSLFSMLGLMAVFNSPFTLISGGLPPFIIAVGTGDSIHILTIFYRLLDRGESREDAIAHAFGHSGLAVVMTTLTTAAGLLSFSFAELTAIADFGIFAAVGVLLALLYTFFMLPAFLSIFPLKEKSAEQKRSVKMDRTLLSLAGFSIRHPKKIIFVSMVILVASTAGMFMIKFSHFPLEMFPDETKIVNDTFLIDDKLRGTVPLEIVIDTKKENGIYDPELLNSIEKFARETEKIQTDSFFVGKVFSITDILKETNRALHGNDPDYYTIPRERKTIAQEFLLFENSGSDDLERVVDSGFSKTRVTIKTSWVDAAVFDVFITDIEKKVKDIFANKAEYTLTGAMPLIARAFLATLDSMTKSYVIAFIMISLMMILLVGDVKIGFASMLPNLLPIVLLMGIMGAFRFPLDMNTIMIGSIAIGIVVDDTVHFIYNFRKYHDKTGDPREAVRETFLGTGRAMLITTLILATVFATNLLCTMENVVRFGSFIALVIVFALMADFILAPALLLLLTGDKGEAEA